MSATQDETLIIIPGWSDGPAHNQPDQADRQSLTEIAMNLDRSWSRKILLPGFSEPQNISDITHHVFHIPPDPERHSMLFWGRAKYMVFTHQSLTISFGTRIHELSLVIPRGILDQNRWSFEYLFGRLLMFCGQIEEDTDLEPFRELKEQKEYCWRVNIEHWEQAALISPKNAESILEQFSEQWESCPEPDEGMLTQASYEAEMKELTWATDPDSKLNKLSQSIKEGWVEFKIGWKDVGVIIDANNRQRLEYRQGVQERFKVNNRIHQETYQSLQRTNQILDDLIAEQGKASDPQSIADDDALGSGEQTESTAYQILDSTRRKIPVNLFFTSDKPLKDVKHMIYYILYVGSVIQEEAISRQDYVIGTSEEPLGESVCYLLQEFYGCTLVAHQDCAIPIDMYDLWNFSRSDPDLDKRNGLWIGRTRRKPLPNDWFDIIEKKCFVPSLAERMTQILRGDIVPYKMGGFPWSDPKIDGEDFKTIQAYQPRSSDEQVFVDEYFDDSPDIDELEFSDRLIESNKLQDEDQKKELLDFVGAMEQHINKLPAHEKNDYADQLEQIKAADSLPELKDKVNSLSNVLYAKSYDTIQYDLAMMSAISEGVISDPPENITQQIQELDGTQGTKTSSVPIIKSTQNIFWITHEASYLNSKLTCVKTTRTLAQARLDAYYILSEGYGAFDENSELSDIEPSEESVCHLLIKYFGYEICEYDDSAIEIDLYDLWNWTQDDIHPTNQSWELWLNLSRFRWGFYPELMKIMDGSLNVDRLPQYPWSSQHRSITGWDCGEYVIEVAFNLFNSQSEAEEFGRSCYALQTNEKYPSLFRLFYGDGNQACIRKNEVVVYRKPSMSYEVNPDDRARWEVTDLSAEDIPDLEISGPLYCQGRDCEETQNLGEKVPEKEEVAVQICNENQSPECIQQDLDNHLTVEFIDIKKINLTRQLRATIRDVVVDVEIGFESHRGDFKSHYDADPSIIETIAKDPRFKELVAISSGMIDYPYVKFPDFRNVNCLDSGDELKRFVESRAYQLGEEYGDSSVAGQLIGEINTCHASEVEVYQFEIRNNAVKGIPFKPSKF